MDGFGSQEPNGLAVQQLEVLVRTAIFKPANALVGSGGGAGSGLKRRALAHSSAVHSVVTAGFSAVASVWVVPTVTGRKVSRASHTSIIPTAEHGIVRLRPMLLFSYVGGEVGRVDFSALLHTDFQ